MFYISNVKTDAPDVFLTPLQEKTYSVLKKLNIPFERVETDKAVTMNDCKEINRVLNVSMVKTLLLCNKNKVNFYLYITSGGKLFDVKKFCKSLGVSRVSFASENDLAELAGVSVGAATIFSALIDNNNRFRVVIDSDVYREKSMGCSDGTTSGFMRVPTDRILHEFLSYVHHEPKIIEV